MKITLSLILIALTSFFITAQNVGQKGDTLLNYTDINGSKQGQWIKKTPEGLKVYEGYFIDNKPVGTFKKYHENGKLKAILKYDNSDTIVRAKLFYRENRPAAIGKYVNNKRDSTWTLYTKQGKRVKTEEWVNGKMHGIQKIYTENGIVIDEANFVMNKAEGPWKQYYDNGSKKFIITHKNNKRNGPSTLYYPSGRIEKKGNYKNDFEEGTWSFYNEKGEHKYDVVYKRGEIIKDGGLIDEQEAEYLKEQEGKGKYVEPQNFNGNPEEYFLNSKSRIY